MTASISQKHAGAGEEGEEEGADDQQGQHGVQRAAIQPPHAAEVAHIEGQGQDEEPGGPPVGGEEGVEDHEEPAAADEDEEATGTVEWDGETYYYYDNFDDIFPIDLTVGQLCDKLAQYWGYGSWKLKDKYDEFYAEKFAAPDKDMLLKDLPEGNYYATVYFEGDQEGAPMYFQKMHFPGRVCFMFGEGHAVG